MKKLFTILLFLAALMNTSVAKEKSDKDKKDWGYLTGSLESTNHFYVEDVANSFFPSAQVQLKGDNIYATNNYLKLDTDYVGETNVVHHLEMLRDAVGFDKIKAAVTNPLKGRKIAAYYGCLLLRPAKVMQFDNPENPTILEDFIKAIGATPVITGYRNECCGGYVTLEDKSIPQKRANMIVEEAMSKGADTIITACPLCLYNLETNSTIENKPAICYFTELLAEALGLK